MFALLAKPTRSLVNQSKCMQASTEVQTQLWHQRYRYLNYKGLRTLKFRNMVKGLPVWNEVLETCTSCLIGKQHRKVEISTLLLDYVL